VLLDDLVGGAKRLQLGHVDVQAPEPLGLLSLRLVVEPPLQVLQTDGRHCQVAPAFHVVGGIAEQQGPFAPRALPRLIATPGPSATLSPATHFPGALVIGQRLLRAFAAGRGGLLQLHDASLLPCRRSHPAGVTRRASQLATAHAAFAHPSRARPPELRSFEATSAFTSVTARALADHPERWPCQWASERRSPFVLPSKLRGLWLLPRRD
jgi:hypothetical protein